MQSGLKPWWNQASRSLSQQKREVWCRLLIHLYTLRQTDHFEAFQSIEFYALRWALNLLLTVRSAVVKVRQAGSEPTARQGTSLAAIIPHPVNLNRLGKALSV